MNKVDLSKYNNDWYSVGAGSSKKMLWFFVNRVFLQSYWLPISSIKVFLLRLFGARIGKGCVIKPGVNIKYPWKLSIGNHCWIGEGVWIDNLAEVLLESNVCLSQGAYLLCGNHNYSKSTFDLMVKSIHLEEGTWVGAKAIVGPGIKMKSHSVLTAASIATQDLEAYTIYQGNPAKAIKKREIGS